MSGRKQQRRLARQQAEANLAIKKERNREAAEEVADVARQKLLMQRRNFGFMSLVRGSLRGFR